MAWGPNRVYLLYIHRRPRSQSELTEVQGLLFRAEVSQDQPPPRGEKGRTGEYTVALLLLATAALCPLLAEQTALGQRG